MAAPTKFSQIRENELGISDGPMTGEQARAIFRRLAAQLNAGLSATNTATAKGLTLSDNMHNDMVTATFTHAVEQKVALVNLKTAASARVLSAESQIVAAVPVVRPIPLAQSGGKPMVGVTIHFHAATTADGKPTSSKVALELLEEGVPSTVVPPWNSGFGA